MAELVLGLGTSHSPLLSIPGGDWAEFAKRDQTRTDLIYPGVGRAVTFDDAISEFVPPEMQDRCGTTTTFEQQFAQCGAALDQLAASLREAKPDVTIIVSDDQDEWFYDSNMPSLAVFWGESAPVVPWPVAADGPSYARAMAQGYGDVALDVPVAQELAKHLIEELMDRDFDIAQMRYVEEGYGGRVARHYPGLTNAENVTAKRPVGLPHGFAFVIKRLFGNAPTPIIPIFQNTCYPPNNVRPSRAYDTGAAIAAAVAAWPDDTRVAIVASGGLSHMVVDEELDRELLDALCVADAGRLRALPRERLYTATSESLNWVTVGGAMAQTSLVPELVDYVPVYRTRAQTGGGWAFMRWTPAQ
jgi:3-O-methylgallate 3,4-dioxygenase